MPNLKTTDFPAADTLTGAEVIGVVQSGNDVKTSLANIISYAIGQQSAIKIGLYSRYGAESTNTISIGGGYVHAGVANGIAIGTQTGAYHSNSVAIGKNALAKYGIAIGENVSSALPDSITIGKDNLTLAAAAITMGRGTYNTGGGFGGIAIGSYIHNNANYTTAVGFASYVIGKGSVALGGFAIGVNGGTAVGYNAIARNNGAIAIGSYAENFVNYSYGIAIGNTAKNKGNSAIALGYKAYTKSNSDMSIAVGSFATTNSFGAVSVGARTYSNSNSVAIGYDAVSVNKSVAIGSGAYTYNTGYNTANSVAIGYKTKAQWNTATAMGAYALASQNGIAIGYKAYGAVEGNLGESYLGTISIGAFSLAKYRQSVALGTGAQGSNYSVSIGAYASTVFEKYGVTQAVAVGYAATALSNAVAIGNHAVAVYSGIAIGNFAYSFAYATTLGTHSRATNEHSIAIGTATLATNGSIAIGGIASTPNSVAIYGLAYGYNSLAISSKVTKDFSIVLGGGLDPPADDQTIGSFTVRGMANSFDGQSLSPTQTDIKLIGKTSAPIAATYVMGYSTVTAIALGAIGNTYTLSIDASTDTARSLSLEATSDNCLIILASDGLGSLLGGDNTFFDIQALFSGNLYFTFSYTDGHSSDILDSPFTGNFSGGADGISAVMTADGDTPIEGNTPTLANNTIGILTGNVIGFQSGILSGSGADDVATFSLAEVTVYRDNFGNYNILGTPTFILINNTGGASGWDVPTLTISGSGDSSILEVSVDYQVTGDIGWMAFLHFETNQ